MASSFKIKLKLPPNPAVGPSSSTQNSPQRSSVPAEGSSAADGGSSMMSEDGGGEGDGEEMDELEDSPPPQNSASESPSSARAKRPSGKSTNTTSSSTLNSGGVKKTTSRPTIPMGLPKPIDQMTIEEIEALPAAKRRKSLKARGAAGPGRGWRKGLKMDQKPVYVQPGSSVGLIPSKVASSTPSSFANSNTKVKSSLARDAISKTSTPFRSESPFSSGSPMPLNNEDRNVDVGVDGKIRKEDEKKAANTTSTSTSAPFRMYYRSTQPIHPIAKIPIGFATVLPLDKSNKSVRSWEKEVREIVSLTGKTWSALTWLTRQQSNAEMEKENQQNNNSTTTNSNNINESLPSRTSNVLGIDDTAPSTPGESTPFSSSNLLRNNRNASLSMEHNKVQSPIASAGTHPGSSPEVDWRGSSAAFSAANKRQP